MPLPTLEQVLPSVYPSWKFLNGSTQRHVSYLTPEATRLAIKIPSQLLCPGKPSNHVLRAAVNGFKAPISTIYSFKAKATFLSHLVRSGLANGKTLIIDMTFA